MRKIALGIGILAVALGVLAIGGTGLALVLENQDAFCAACHTQPEQAFYEQSRQPSAATLAALHTQKQTACIDCHSGSGTLGRAVGLSQGAHDLFAYLSGTYNKPAVTTNPLGDDTCLNCHGDVVKERPGAALELNGHYHVFLTRWQSVDPNAAHCTTCHTAHSKGLESLQFMAQGQVARVCDDCHTALSGDIR